VNASSINKSKTYGYMAVSDYGDDIDLDLDWTTTTGRYG